MNIHVRIELGSFAVRKVNGPRHTVHATFWFKNLDMNIAHNHGLHMTGCLYFFEHSNPVMHSDPENEM
jgi:hypothetical protein